MAAHLFLGRFLSVVLLVLFGLAGVARADHFLTHPAAAPLLAEAAPQAAKATARAAKNSANAAPGLLGIATQAYRTQSWAGTANKAYSLADAMRDAVWRKKTAAKLKTLMSARKICTDGEDGATRAKPSIGLAAVC